MSADIEQASRAACLLLWPEAEAMRFDPRCCRFPKSCSIPDAEQNTVRVLTGGSGLSYDPNPPCVVDHQSIPPGRSCPHCGERSPWRDTGGAGVGAETIESLRAELAGLKDLLDSSVLRGQGYCGGRHWNGGTCFHPAGHPEGFPAHYGQDAEARAVAAEFDKANLAREVDHLQRESAHAHERIAAARRLIGFSEPSDDLAAVDRALSGATR